MKVFILLSVVAVAFASRQCGENEHYNTCGTACPLTCDNYNDGPPPCIKICMPGCHCDEGYVRSGDGRCVKPEECHANADVCGENKHYESCGTACPLTCDNYDNPPRACILMCNSGCHCDKGYVKTRDGRCVLPEECPSRVQSDVEICSMEHDTGMCRGYFVRYYFNQKSGRCEEFIYGGCGGNENNFKSLEECSNKCA